MRKTAIGLAVTLLVLMTWSPVTADDVRLTYRSSTLWSRVTGIVSQDTLLYCKTVNGLMILNVADPTQPQLVSRLYLPHGMHSQICLRGSLLYIVEDDGWLTVVGISDPARPQVVGEFPMRGRGEALDVVDTLAYVGYGNWNRYTGLYPSGLQILNVSRPEAITEVGALHYPDSGTMSVNEVKVVGEYAYVKMEALLWVVDVSNPASPSRVGYLPQNDTLGRWYIPVDIQQGPSDTLLLAANISEIWPVSYSSLDIINIADPRVPALAGRCEFDEGAVLRVALADTVAVVTHGRRGVPLITVANPADPDTIGRYGRYEFYFAVALAVRESLLFVADGGPVDDDVETAARLKRSQPAGIAGSQDLTAPPLDLHIVNIANPTQPSRIGGYTFPQSVTGVIPGGRYAYALYGGNEGPDDLGPDVTVVDLADPDSPVIRGTYRTSGMAVGGVVADTLLYLAVGSLEILNVADPDNPRLVGSTLANGSCNDIEIRGNLIFAASGRAGLNVIDISDPFHPSVIGTVRTREYADGIALNDHYAYVGDAWSGMAVVDISDPSHPQLLPYYDNNRIIGGSMIVQDSSLFVQTWGGFLIYDIGSDPARPLEINGFPDYWLQMFALRYPYLYIANSDDSLVVVDVSDRRALRIAGTAATPGWTVSVAVDDQHLYAADQFSLIVFDWSSVTDAPETPPSELPGLFTLRQNYPNPFNPSTTITYDLSRRSDVRLSIYNVLGQEVATLVDGAQPAGRHEVRWEAPDRASGVYFYQLSIDSRAESRKMILLK